MSKPLTFQLSFTPAEMAEIKTRLNIEPGTIEGEVINSDVDMGYREVNDTVVEFTVLKKNSFKAKLASDQKLEAEIRSHIMGALEA